MVAPDLERIVKALVNLEKSKDLTEAKQLVNKRQNFRKDLKLELEQKKNLPKSSNYFAGFINAGERIQWKSLAYALMSKYNLPEKEFENMLESYRSKTKRLIYGKLEEIDKEKLKQFEFAFITPDINN